MFVIDRSGSMGQELSAGSGTSKWALLSDALLAKRSRRSIKKSKWER